MIDKELADKVVARGVGRKINGLFYLQGAHSEPVDAEFFVIDWRVAGAIWEKLMVTEYDMVALMINAQYKVASDDMKWSRAIIEACVEALTVDHDGPTQ